MKKPLKKINVAGIWTIDVALELHSDSITSIDNYLMELNEAITLAAVKIGNKTKHKVNVKAVHTTVHNGI